MEQTLMRSAKKVEATPRRSLSRLLYRTVATVICSRGPRSFAPLHAAGNAALGARAATAWQEAARPIHLALDRTHGFYIESVFIAQVNCERGFITIVIQKDLHWSNEQMAAHPQKEASNAREAVG